MDNYKQPHMSSGQGLLPNELAANLRKKNFVLQSLSGSESKIKCCGPVSTYLVGLKVLSELGKHTAWSL